MNKTIDSLQVTASTLVNALGNGKRFTLDAMFSGSSGLRNASYPEMNFNTFLGLVDKVEDVELENHLKKFSCRNNKLAKLALDVDNFRDEIDRAINKYGKNRIGVFIGTSTSGITETENAYIGRDKDTGKLPNIDMLYTDNTSSVQRYVCRSLGLTGVGMVISTACSSSAKVFASAHRYIAAGLFDAVVVGGVDSICLTTLYGFNSLQLISEDICRPWDKNRQGINIGEAAGFMLLEKSANNNYIHLTGYGESSDAHHISSPHPEGVGGKIAIKKALTSSGINPSDVDYINLHGTATLSNDYSESRGLSSVFNSEIICSSTKGMTGHTLGAAGINEAIICTLALENSIIPANINLHTIDDNLPIRVPTKCIKQSLNHVMSNSFGFGGSNCSLIFSC
ncbi:3-oxoacyl-[ACP] synthase (EC 2.3.1.41) FabV like [uncultured Gammaproteobacteria bacterium]|jgi:3-oxoacyl-[acyl-carrier-protein] synthase-1|uniref:3-oxoacyl-ACP synthase n=3 Tax=sulfur-oxidizing symbionts TaxID=32036 RepID=A0A1H6MQG1_9GAMM|nr:MULTISPECIES: beta-ketoacyl-[acyl-carrier-protein] synthase family protein [sulfur-oxidizing symbionts]CAC5816907.1 3-oxoacyl-[ACP] synthase (EC 2.3.1.41) FabV like [uncultured Gammaproteobacteria bacterium]CAB5499385.1 3-oxoacyl-[ACP] synthase (EC FabV like [Bathymodiolus thermophilus thioautotrophic gill symbiont]CAB5504989.1 3-oxoacyl-[ACP] synthase (EC FabV like [Bathymodiolus azoricus thioautotrophic gill symbiont]CAC9496472.1 3-oxoacyl-[ACP] synthase (EC 2.3.1.41) FabV like [uncultured